MSKREVGPEAIISNGAAQTPILNFSCPLRSSAPPLNVVTDRNHEILFEPFDPSTPIGRSSLMPPSIFTPPSQESKFSFSLPMVDGGVRFRVR